MKQARQYSGLTQEEIAEKMDMHRDTYRKLETNPEKATVEQARLFSQIVGIGLDQIFFAGEST